ncbi:MAG: Fic family protein [Acidimicrobiales bacterium]
MSKVVKHRWISDFSGPSKPDRRSCEYEAYLPDGLLDRRFGLDGDVAAEVTDAEASIARLNVSGASLVNTETLARILLRAEAVASSRIEGLDIGARRLLHAEVARGLNKSPSDVSATEVLANIDAMIYGIESIGLGDQITEGLLLEVHRRLLVGTRLEVHGGHYREVQNWIGGSSYNPCSAAFVPPPPENVPELMADLCGFANDDGLPAVAQAAIAHAQFETIHPFVDGNGRTGRVLIHLILRRRGVALRVLPPVSLVLATWSEDYVTALNGVRYRGPSTSRDAHAGMNRWIAQFSIACSRAVADADEFEGKARDIQDAWRERIGSLRKHSAADLLLSTLVGAPVVTVNSAAALIGRTYPAANNAISQLVQAGVLRQVNIGRRNRAYEAPEIIAAFTDLERQLASPEGDTKTSEPVKRVPRRR